MFDSVSFDFIWPTALCVSNWQPHSWRRFYSFTSSAAEIGNYYFGPGHPNKPHRIRMCHNLLLNYHVYEKMDVYRPPAATEQEFTKFHADDYIKFLQMITPQNMANHAKQIQRFNIGDDCPIFDGLYDFCKTSAGGSIAGAVKLNFDKADVAVNWAGGLHHAKKCEASGFCFVNDIVSKS